jgi:hypothetical protein
MRHFISKYMTKIACWLDGSGWNYDEFNHGYREGILHATRSKSRGAAVDDSQGPISIEITEDDDGEVDITLYDANNFSCGGVTIIQGKKIVATLLVKGIVVSSDTYTIGKYEDSDDG